MVHVAPRLKRATRCHRDRFGRSGTDLCTERGTLYRIVVSAAPLEAWKGPKTDPLYTPIRSGRACARLLRGGVERVRFGPFQTSRGAADTTIR